jgi:hypothetical protein
LRSCAGRMSRRHRRQAWQKTGKKTGHPQSACRQSWVSPLLEAARRTAGRATARGTCRVIRTGSRRQWDRGFHGWRRRSSIHTSRPGWPRLRQTDVEARRKGVGVRIGSCACGFQQPAADARSIRSAPPQRPGRVTSARNDPGIQLATSARNRFSTRKRNPGSHHPAAPHWPNDFPQSFS